MAVKTVTYHQLVCDDCGEVDSKKSLTAAEVLAREEDDWLAMDGYSYPGDNDTFEEFILTEVTEEFGELFRHLVRRSRDIEPFDRRVLLELESIANPQSGSHQTGKEQIARAFQAPNGYATTDEVEGALRTAEGAGYLICISDGAGVSTWEISTPQLTQEKRLSDAVDPGVPDVSRIGNVSCPPCHSAFMDRVLARAMKDGL